MKKFFLPIFAVLLVLGSILPLAAYRVTRAVLSGAEPASSAASSAVSSPAASAQPPSAVPSADAETFLVEDQATGQCWSFPVRNTFWVLSPPRCR